MFVLKYCRKIWLVLLLAIPLLVSAIDTNETGFRLQKKIGTVFSLVIDAHSIKWNVKNNNIEKDYFIPTKTEAEWSAFLAHLPVGVELASVECDLPWGGTIEDWEDVTAYASSSVACGASCNSETRTCSSWVLSGSYTNSSCSPSCTSGVYTYSSWSSCNVSCGQGTQYRAQYCNYDSCYSPQATSQSCWSGACPTVGVVYGGGLYVAPWLVVTPGGCTDSTTPTCSGWLDTVKKTWGAYEIVTGVTNNTNGENNTNTLSSSYSDTYAAKYCANMVYGGYDDWFLPAKDQFNLLYWNKVALGGFVDSYYRSSTEVNEYNAWIKSFVNGNSTGSSKVSSYYVRCVRSY